MSEGKHISFDHPVGQNRYLTDAEMAAYLSGTLTPEEQHALELLLTDEELSSDAIDGLQEIPLQEARAIAVAINHQVARQVRKHGRRRKIFTTDQRWILMAVLLVLLLAIMAWMVLRMMTLSH